MRERRGLTRTPPSLLEKNYTAHIHPCLPEVLLKQGTQDCYDKEQRKPALTRDTALPASQEACSSLEHTVSPASIEAGAPIPDTQTNKHQRQAYG